MFVKRIRTFWADESSLAINNAAFTVDQCRVCKSSWVVTMNFTGLEQNGQILEVTFSLRLIMIEPSECTMVCSSSIASVKFL